MVIIFTRSGMAFGWRSSKSPSWRRLGALSVEVVRWATTTPLAVFSVSDSACNDTRQRLHRYIMLDIPPRHSSLFLEDASFQQKSGYLTQQQAETETNEV